ncbi:MAG: cytochrome ubiquinol oxidase subunit I, partial [candidate division Zixibacteria bacterium]|nr:cytochrome ubiquinol oxidase subunit I [candidate division Zixibacteria bacterium]
MMDYPFWDISVGYGMLMAIVAVVHVFVSHFAIGGGLYLVVAESFARRNSDTLKLDFLKKLSKFFVLVTLVFGALTGVAIWFIIGLLNPAATEALIHHFVWAWASEWCFFLIEILAAIIYLYGWDKMTPRNHLVVGWIYFGAAWMSLFIINGILSF